LVNGYSGIIPKELMELARETENFPDKRSIEAIPTCHVVYSARWKRGFNRRSFEEKLRQHGAEIIQRDEYGNYLLRLCIATDVDTAPIETTEWNS
jgi:hypothetical protein